MDLSNQYLPPYKHLPETNTNFLRSTTASISKVPRKLSTNNKKNHNKNSISNNGELGYSNQHFYLKQVKMLAKIWKTSSQKHWSANKLLWNHQDKFQKKTYNQRSENTTDPKLVSYWGHLPITIPEIWNFGFILEAWKEKEGRS